SGWTGGPHYRVDSNYNTKSPSLNCGDDDATNTPTPSPTLTLTPTSTPTCEWWQQLLDWQCVDPTPTNTDTPSPTLEDIPTFTATASVVPDDTPTFTATASVAPDDTPTFTATASFVPDDTPTGTTAVCQEDYYWNGEYCVPDPLGCNRETGQIEPYFGESLPEGWGPVDDPVCNPVIASVTPVGESFGRTCDNSYVATFIRNLQNKGIYDPEKHYPEFEKICPDGAGSVLPRLWPWLVGAGMVYGLFAFLRRKMYATTKQ
ncbi:MAG TPA: hypothetical protein VFI61_01660, partial [Patescibacteria group bacterium]|nr:hypothetical protein [Patescibacteria group bacterium]